MGLVSSAKVMLGSVFGDTTVSGLVKIATVYTGVAQRICEIA